MNIRMAALLPISIATILAACAAPEGGIVQTHLTGGATSFAVSATGGNISAVNVTITSIEAVHAGGGGYEALVSEPQNVDLAALEGISQLLGEQILPAGRYATMRLRVADGATVTVDGVDHPLAVPSGAQTGIQIAGTFDVDDGGEYQALIEFDADQSVSFDGSGYVLAPAIRLVSFGSDDGTPAPSPSPSPTASNPL